MTKIYSVQVGTEKFQVDGHEQQELLKLIDGKGRGLFNASGGSFLIEKVNSIKPLNFADYNQPEQRRVYVSDEQRLKNARRMHIAKLWLKRKQNPALLIEEQDRAEFDKFSAWMASPGKQERIKLRAAFSFEFFDVQLADEAEAEFCFQSWLPFHDGSRDPRQYKREDHTPEALGLREENSLLKTATKLFGVEA